MGTEARPPAQWADKTRYEFEKLVCQGGEVATLGLAQRIEKAVTLVCHHAGNNLIGVAALKRPEDTYRTKVSQRSGLKLSKDAFPFELGWVYVKPERRGRGLSKQLVATCLAAADSAGVFATTREDNDPMRCCLAKSGFMRLGRPYKSRNGDYYLVVYVREAPKRG